MAKRARAAVRLARGEPRRPRDLALASADAAGAAGAPIEAARSQALAGRALAMAGERTQAVRAPALRGAGIRRVRRRRATAARPGTSCGGSEREPSRAGRPARADGGLESLSRREREIAELVTARKTNREMAAELFLSEKTVESHLRNIFAKLGASSRVEVARAVERAAS